MGVVDGIIESCEGVVMRDDGVDEDGQDGDGVGFGNIPLVVVVLGRLPVVG